MITRLQKIDSRFADEINYSMFLRQTPRPRAGCEIFEGFGFADAAERFAYNRFD